MSSSAWLTLTATVLSSIVALTAAWLGARLQRATTERTLRAQFEENERVRHAQQAETDKARESAWLQERRKLMHDEKRRAYGEFITLAGEYPAIRAWADTAAARAERRQRKLIDERRRIGWHRDAGVSMMYDLARKDHDAAQARLRETTRKIELVLADLRLITPFHVVTAAEDAADLLYDQKPADDQTATFIMAARQDLGAD
ncbi:hypothetical protein AB0M46_30055 [Dactylosporangium sp. NPDC051485]|uniref:hypothetical protein n=1 Tax=Dactylosporangium sp. NPDC051485 TaxID=3154846 RepID=UPI00343A27CB